MTTLQLRRPGLARSQAQASFFVRCEARRDTEEPSSWHGILSLAVGRCSVGKACCSAAPLGGVRCMPSLGNCSSAPGKEAAMRRREQVEVAIGLHARV